jgi:hypothetical protein
VNPEYQVRIDFVRVYPNGAERIVARQTTDLIEDLYVAEEVYAAAAQAAEAEAA